MHLRLVTASLLLLPNLAFADVAVRCHATVTSPQPGATAVSPDVVIRGSTACQVQAPLFVDDAGATVPAKFATQDTGGGATFTLTPLAPLAANHTYSVTFPDHLPCDGPLGQTQFTVGGTPGIRAVQFQSGADAVAGLDVYLTEPVLHAADLANGTTWVTATVDGYALVPSRSRRASTCWSSITSCCRSGQRWRRPTTCSCTKGCTLRRAACWPRTWK